MLKAIPAILPVVEAVTTSKVILEGISSNVW